MTATKTSSPQLALTPFESKVYDALRAEVRDLTDSLKTNGTTLSPRFLRTSAERLVEVARFAEAFQQHGVAPTTSPSAAVKIVDGHVVAPNGDHEVQAATVVALKKAGKTWREISEATQLSVTQARYLFKKSKGGRRS